jgi:hypothetical protein
MLYHNAQHYALGFLPNGISSGKPLHLFSLHIAYSSISLCLSHPWVHHTAKMGPKGSAYWQGNGQLQTSNLGQKMKKMNIKHCWKKPDL